MSGVGASRKWLQLKYHSFFPTLITGEALAAPGDQERVALTLLPMQRQGAAAVGRPVAPSMEKGRTARGTGAHVHYFRVYLTSF